MKFEQPEQISKKKKFKKILKTLTKRENLAKIVVIVSSLALLGSSILPFLR
ncbi:MAG TPA: hypothetical protein VLI92_02105 [Candidatus Saccharimonadales bacterium]|nr:hypothetical protein [Candidatus Saccharimonadales bacterium]